MIIALLPAAPVYQENEGKVITFVLLGNQFDKITFGKHEYNFSDS